MNDIEQAVRALERFSMVESLTHFLSLLQCATLSFPALTAQPGPQTSVAPVLVLDSIWTIAYIVLICASSPPS